MDTSHISSIQWTPSHQLHQMDTHTLSYTRWTHTPSVTPDGHTHPQLHQIDTHTLSYTRWTHTPSVTPDGQTHPQIHQIDTPTLSYTRWTHLLISYVHPMDTPPHQLRQIFITPTLSAVITPSYRHTPLLPPPY